VRVAFSAGIALLACAAALLLWPQSVSVTGPDESKPFSCGSVWSPGFAASDDTRFDQRLRPLQWLSGAEADAFGRCVDVNSTMAVWTVAVAAAGVACVGIGLAGRRRSTRPPFGVKLD
jgi:hypothetical protein